MSSRNPRPTQGSKPHISKVKLEAKTEERYNSAEDREKGLISEFPAGVLGAGVDGVGVMGSIRDVVLPSIEKDDESDAEVGFQCPGAREPGLGGGVVFFSSSFSSATLVAGDAVKQEAIARQEVVVISDRDAEEDEEVVFLRSSSVRRHTRKNMAEVDRRQKERE